VSSVSLHTRTTLPCFGGSLACIDMVVGRRGRREKRRKRRKLVWNCGKKEEAKEGGKKISSQSGKKVVFQRETEIFPPSSKTPNLTKPLSSKPLPVRATSCHIRRPSQKKSQNCVLFDPVSPQPRQMCMTDIPTNSTIDDVLRTEMVGINRKKPRPSKQLVVCQKELGNFLCRGGCTS